MRYIEPHAHMVSRVTDDYERMALAGCRAVCEPAFWAGFDRGSAEGFRDYFKQITEHEPKRAARFHLRHYAWVCVNPKEAEDVAFAREVLALLPEFLDKPNVLGIGEIGLNKNTRNELVILEEHLALAEKHDALVLVHTPHLEDKLKGTRLILDTVKNFPGIRAERVIIDHVEEHTVRLVLGRGHWAGLTLYPLSKCTPGRAADVIESCGAERLWVNSACDWGASDPLAPPKLGLELHARGHSWAAVDRVLFQNPRDFLAQGGKFTVEE
jgi:predicted metal-dependent TIM-barrel fold hydrolase